jgi:sigma-E factor negative regulatory protein RseB
LPLSGTYLHQMNASLETYRIVRAGSGDNIQEKRTSLDGPSREIIRKGLELSATRRMQSRCRQPR